MHGFQLWANLPARLKMTAPRYQDIPAAEIPEIVDDDGTRVRVIMRRLLGQARTRWTELRRSRATSTFSLPAGRRKTLPVEIDASRLRLRVRGIRHVSGASKPFGVLTEKETGNGETLVRERTGNRSLVLFDSGDAVTVEAGEEGIRFFLVSGQADRGTGRLVRADRDEHQGGAAASGGRTQRRHLHQANKATCGNLP